MWHLVYCVTHSVVPVNSSMLTLTLYSLVRVFTSCSRDLLKKLTGFQLVNSPHFMEPEGSLPRSREETTTRIEFWFVKVVPKYLNSSTFSKDLLSILHQVYEYNGLCVYSEQLHQEVQVQCAEVPATEHLRTVPAPFQLLLPVPVGAAADPNHQLANPNHHCCASYWCAGTRCSKGCLRWPCEWQLTA